MKHETPDWPADGPIHLNIHDLPHASSSLESWHATGECHVAELRRFAFFAAFVRRIEGYHPATRAPRYTHSLTWAIYDLTGQQCAFVSRVDARASEDTLRRVRAQLGSRDEHYNRALAELLERAQVPEPDRVFDGPIHVSQEPLALDFAGDSFRKHDDGSYELRLFDERHSFGCQLQLKPLKAALRLGNNGSVHGPEGETQFAYCLPRCEVTGQIFHRGTTHKLTQGQGAYSHAFGSGVVDDPDPVAEALLGKVACEKLQSERRARFRARQVGQQMLSVQLSDGSELCCVAQKYLESGQSAGTFASITAAVGGEQHFSDATLEPSTHWQSPQTFCEYPVRFRLRVPSAQLDLEVRAAFDDQEIVTLLARRSFYAGRVEVSGTRDGHTLSGVGFLEQCSQGLPEDLPSLLSQVDKLVRRKVEALVPEQPQFEQAAYLLTTIDKPHYMHGVDIQQYARAHLHPIRAITDRGSEAWRCYAIQACIDVVGGNSREFNTWIAVPELLQAGARIVEDVETKTRVRRGGPAAHELYGEAQAINSGTAAFFMGAPLLRDGNLSDRQVVALYELYFDGLRAGHAGQALDLDGFSALLQRAIESDELAQTLVNRVRAVQRLKTGVPAGCLARIGALAGGGTAQQVEALGRFFEDVGIAYQIIEEVSDRNITQLTLPVARAMTLLRTTERRALVEALRSQPQSAALRETVERCGAIEACRKEAQELSEASWSKLEPLLPASLAKLTLRAFSLYAATRA
ncbi:MAG TPA: polyprenyl synthetase family protein [Polyangiales bacterium]|nr:polyprenyl synthetase family protein [Polyangiales bacterium]